MDWHLLCGPVHLFVVLYVIIFWRGGSLWPCVISHGVLNSLSAFSATGESMVRVVILCVLVVAYAVVVLKTLPKGESL